MNFRKDFTVIIDNLKAYMEKTGIKHSKVAEHLGMSKATFSSTINGNRTLTAEEYVSVCDFLEVPYSKFVDGD